MNEWMKDVLKHLEGFPMARFIFRLVNGLEINVIKELAICKSSSC